MNDLILGHALGALPPAEDEQFQALLTTDPEAAAQLARVRQFLAPLEADKDGITPPPDLLGKTIARVAEYLCTPGVTPPFPTKPPDVPPSKPRHSDPDLGSFDVDDDDDDIPHDTWPSDHEEGLPASGRWRRRDLFVGLGVLGLLALLAWPTLGAMRSRQQLLACQSNLSRFHLALHTFADTNEGKFPAVQDRPPYNTAGAYVPLLHGAGVLPADLNLQCPAHGSTTVTALGDNPVAPPAAYAFSLGYSDGGRLAGLRQRFDDMDCGLLPILADIPPPEGHGDEDLPRPHGVGQNVLFINGNVRFCSTPLVGLDDDDIYHNKNGRARAGVDRRDTVLGKSHEQP